MKLTESEKKKIKDKLIVASGIISEAYNLVRCLDNRGESDLAIHIDSIYNDIDDALDILKGA